MTVTTSYSALTYNCNGSTTAFSVTWPFFLSSDLVVTRITAAGVESALALTTDYTVSGGRASNGVPGSGTVTTVATYADGKIRITRSTPKTQSTSFTEAGAFPAKTVEALIDRSIMIAEEGAGGPGIQDIDGSALRLETGGATDYWDGESYIARGFADGVNDDDLATVGQIAPYVADAEAAATAAAASEAAAAASETAAASSASAASSSASAASASASTASTQATNASNSASAASTSATNASNSASAASTSASNAATSATEAAAAVGFGFTYSTTTTMADPGTGVVRFNNATLASVTAIAIDDLSADTGNPDVSAWILTFDNSSATNKGTLRFRKKSAPQNFVDYTVTALTDNSGWSELAVTHAASNGSLSNSDTLLMAFYATGDVGPAGPTGSGSGDVNGPASAVASELVLFDGTTGKLIKRATTTGIIKATSGVVAAAVSGTDYAPATSGSAILKGNGAGGFSSAVASTDYAPVTSGSAILKGNGAGGFSSAVSATDYAPATSGSAILKGNGSGGFSSAVAGTDYAGLSSANTFTVAQTVSYSSAETSVGSGFLEMSGSNAYIDLKDSTGEDYDVRILKATANNYLSILTPGGGVQIDGNAVVHAGNTTVKAFINFNGTGTPASRASSGVSSLTDHGTGNYTIGFTTAMNDANYIVTGTAIHDDGGGTAPNPGIVTEDLSSSSAYSSKTTTSCRIDVRDHTGALFDAFSVNVIFVRL